MRGWGKYDIGTAVKKKTGKSFIDYMGPEDHLQHSIITWCKWKKIRYHHSPGGIGRRTAFDKFKSDYLGIGAGFPDLIFPQYLLIIELKVLPNKVKKGSHQEDWINFFKSIGWRAEVCYSFDEAVKVITQELSKNIPQQSR